MSDNIPKGFRFHPTGEELIDYLHSKRNGEPLPWNGIIYKDLYGQDAEPWVVFANDFQCYCHNENKGTFTRSTIFVFTKLISFPQKKSQNNSDRVSRYAGKGTWSSRTKTMKIFRSGTDKIIGVTRMLSFKIRNSGGASQDFGNWTMHEYSLNKTSNGAPGDLVVCKITRSVKNNAGSSCRQPLPLFCSPVIANGGSSECIQIASKRPAEECSFQERKVQKCFSNGSAAEVKPPPQLSSPAIACVEEDNEEKLGDDSTFSKALEPEMEPHNGLNSARLSSPAIACVEEVNEEKPGDDGTFSKALEPEMEPHNRLNSAWLSSPAIACVEEVNEEKPGNDGTFSKALEPEMEPHNGLNSARDENIEPPYGGTADAATAIAEDDDDSCHLKAILQDQNTEPPLLEDSYDINVKSCGSLPQAAAAECDPLLQASIPSALNDHDLGFDVASLLDDPLQDENIEAYSGTAEAVTAIAEDDDDSCHLKALLQDQNTEPPLLEDLYDINVKSCSSAAAECDPLLQVSNPSALDDHDLGFDVDSLLDDPLQVSPPSPGYYDFNTDLDSLFNVEQPLWSYRR